MNNRKMVTSKKSSRIALHEIHKKMLAQFSLMTQLNTSGKKVKPQKTYHMDKRVLLVSFFQLIDEKKVVLSLTDIEEKCKRRELRYRDIRYDIISLNVMEEHIYPDGQIGFIAFANDNKDMTPTFAYNQYPTITDTSVCECHSWKVMGIGDYFLEEPVNWRLYFDVYYALAMIDVSERIPKTVSKDIEQDLLDLYL